MSLFWQCLPLILFLLTYPSSAATTTALQLSDPVSSLPPCCWFLRGTEVAFRAKKEVKNFDIHWLDVSVRFAFIFISLRTSHSPRTLISGNLRERQTQSLPAALSRQFFQIWLICKTEECFFPCICYNTH